MWVVGFTFGVCTRLCMCMMMYFLVDLMYGSGVNRDVIVFFFNDTATTEIYTLSLHDALPISHAQTESFSLA